MFLKIGRFFFFSSFKYLLLLTFLASFLGIQFYLYVQKQNVQEEAFYLSQLIHKAEATRKRRALSQKKIQQLANANANFLYEFSESFIIDSSGKKNNFIFLPEKTQKNSHFIETTYQLQKEVCIGKEELEKFFCHLEKVPIGNFSPLDKTPDFVITRMQLQKKQNEFEIYLHLLERKRNL